MRPSVDDLRRSCAELRSAGSALAARDPGDIAGRLGAVAERLSSPADPLRAEALERIPREAGLSPAMAEYVLDGMLRDWTEEALGELLRREFDAEETFSSPELILTVGSGTVPGVTATALIRALLVGSPTLVKPGAGDRALPELWARGISEVDPELGSAAAVRYWPGADDPELLRAALEEADAVVVYGSDRTVRAIREALSEETRLIAYPHRIGLAAIGRDLLDSERARRLAHELAMAVATFDQRGCVSPHAVYVEEGGETTPEEFAELVAEGLSALHGEYPPGEPDEDEAAQAGQWRGAQEMRAAADPRVRYLSRSGEDWAVVYDPGAGFAPSCLRRSLWVRSLEDLDRLPDRLRPAGRFLQTLGLETERTDRATLERALRETGVTRICPVAEIPWPRAWWRHDGVGPLRTLVGLDPSPDA